MNIIQTKVIFEASEVKLQDKLNIFLLSLAETGKDLQDIKLSTTMVDEYVWFTALVIYELIVDDETDEPFEPLKGPVEVGPL